MTAAQSGPPAMEIPEDTLADFSNGPALMTALAAPLEWGGAVSADRLSGRSRA